MPASSKTSQGRDVHWHQVQPGGGVWHTAEWDNTDKEWDVVIRISTGQRCPGFDATQKEVREAAADTVEEFFERLLKVSE